jgi:hypothetical protein
LLEDAFVLFEQQLLYLLPLLVGPK